jgi:hypothetical protein
MKKKTSQRAIAQGQELSDAELEQAVGGTGLQEASVAPGGLVPAASAGSVQIQAETAQLLQLQMEMQHENRSYTAISNILKTKHDTAKNSISNVR